MSEWTRGRVLDFIRAYIRERGYAPSMREIGDGVGLSSLSSVAHHLARLELEGRIYRPAGVPRAIVVGRRKQEATGGPV